MYTIEENSRQSLTNHNEFKQIHLTNLDAINTALL